MALIRIRRKALQYCFVFVGVWALPLTSRAIMLAPNTWPPPWLVIAHSFSVSLIGFLDVLVYSNFWVLWWTTGYVFFLFGSRP